MKKVNYLVFSAILMAGMQGMVTAQEQTKPSRTAVVDMEYVFKNYKKFDEQRTALRGQVVEAEKQFQARLQELKALQQKFVALKAGSAEYKKQEIELAGKAADAEASRQVLRRDFARKEAALYREIYLEVTDAVQRYAKYYNYNLVMRFSRSTVGEFGEPQSTLKSMNRQVVYYDTQDDISDAVLDFLNKSHSKGTASPK